MIDVQSIFHQVRVPVEDRDFMRFLWCRPSLRGRRSKGKAKGIRAEETLREGGGRRERLQGSHCFRHPAY